MSERSWGSPREVYEQGARTVEARFMPLLPYLGFFSAATA